MLVAVADELRRKGLRLIIARHVGQVRDILHRADEQTPVETFPIVRLAVDAARSG